MGGTFKEKRVRDYQIPKWGSKGQRNSKMKDNFLEVRNILNSRCQFTTPIAKGAKKICFAVLFPTKKRIFQKSKKTKHVAKRGRVST